MSDLTGLKLTKGYYSRDRKEAHTRRNVIETMALRIFNGTQAEYRKLPVGVREQYRETATGMYELGVDGPTAQRAESSNKRGFVYVITNKAWPEYVKIGRAFNPESRLSLYQTHSPKRDYELYGAVYFEDCFAAEAEIHARLSVQHRNGALGEWFNITPFLARHEINKLRSII